MHFIKAYGNPESNEMGKKKADGNLVFWHRRDHAIIEETYLQHGRLPKVFGQIIFDQVV